MKQTSGGGVVGGDESNRANAGPLLFFFFCFTPPSGRSVCSLCTTKDEACVTVCRVQLFICSPLFSIQKKKKKKKKGKGLTRGENDAVTDPSSIEKAVAQTGCDCLIFFFFFFFFRAQGAAERTKKYIFTHTPEGKRRLLSMNERC